MKKQPKTPITITLTFPKEDGVGYVVLGLPKPVKSKKQLFQLIIKSPV
ncbi:hypothetical protein [Pedobacter sp. Hv1]|nr:hypothetical protein [Pedobacter sp. Hv1]